VCKILKNSLFVYIMTPYVCYLNNGNNKNNNKKCKNNLFYLWCDKYCAYEENRDNPHVITQQGGT
jgi:hypothetical protein